MIKPMVLRVGEEIFDVLRKMPMSSFNQPLTGENVEIVRQWAHCDKILMSHSTQEYIFVNNIDEAQIIEE